MKKLLKAALVLIALALLAWVVWPARIDPVAWTPGPPPKLEGVYAENSLLKNVQRFGVGVGIGPEGIAVDAQGRIYAGYADGRLVLFSANGASYQELANTGGRPLGTAAAADGGLWVADASKGLLYRDRVGNLQVVLDAVDGTPIRYADDVDVGADGNVYFSDVSTRFVHHQDVLEVLEHRCTGRLVQYDPVQKAGHLLLSDLCFANGIAVAPDARYVLINETGAYRIRRYWLKGEKAGTADVFADNLPGLPDNISTGNGRFWVALYAPRDLLLDALMPGPLWLRKLVSKLPSAIITHLTHKSWVLGFDPDGKVIANLQYQGDDAYAPITSAEEHGPWLYFGSLSENSLARLPLREAIPEAPPPPPDWQQTPAKPHHFEPPKLGYNPPDPSDSRP